MTQPDQPPTPPNDRVESSDSTPTASAPSTPPKRRVQIGQSYVVPKPNPSVTATSTPDRPGPDSGSARRPRRDRDEDDGPARRSLSQIDRDLDQAMAESVRNLAPPSFGNKPLKKLWDEELEAEFAETMGDFDFGDLEDQGGTRRESKPPGSKLAGPRKGRMIAVRGENVFIDLGGKSEGVVPLTQFLELNRPIPAKGEEVEVLVERFDPSEGVVRLNLRGAVVEANWDNLQVGTPVEARVTKVNKGGLDVDVDGIRGFLPISQIELGRVEDASVYLNQRLKCLVTEANPRLKNLVVSRRALLEREREELREKTWAELAEGQVRQGKVRTVRDFGAFVDLGGVDGLLHVSDMSWVRNKDARAVVSVGQELTVKVLKIDRENRKVSLGLKQLTVSPWDDLAQRLAPGDIVKVKVTKIMDFGAFAEIEPAVEGLIHISELANRRVNRVSDVLKEGDELEVKILSIDPAERKIALSLRQALEVKARAQAEQDQAEDQADDQPDDDPPPAKPKPTVPLKGGLARHGDDAASLGLNL